MKGIIQYTDRRNYDNWCSKILHFKIVTIFKTTETVILTQYHPVVVPSPELKMSAHDEPGPVDDNPLGLA